MYLCRFTYYFNSINTFIKCCCIKHTNTRLDSYILVCQNVLIVKYLIHEIFKAIHIVHNDLTPFDINQFFRFKVT